MQHKRQLSNLSSQKISDDYPKLKDSQPLASTIQHSSQRWHESNVTTPVEQSIDNANFLRLNQSSIMYERPAKHVQPCSADSQRHIKSRAAISPNSMQDIKKIHKLSSLFFNPDSNHKLQKLLPPVTGTLPSSPFTKERK